MNISPILMYRYDSNNRNLQNRKINANQQIAFKGIPSGRLGRTTIDAVDSVLMAYRDIVSKLNLKTDEGIEAIHKAYPDIKIGEGLVFHNCGDKNVSIAVKSAESSKYSGLTKIIVRQGNSTWSERIVLDSFLLKNNDRLVKNFDKTHLKSFPEEYEFESQQIIDDRQYDKKLQDIMENLDFAMLKFRKFLSKNADTFIKPPDGIIPYDTGKKLNSIDNITNNIALIKNSFSSAIRNNMYKGFDDYVQVTGSQCNIFRCDNGNLLEYSNIKSVQYDNLKRLVVYDSDKKPLRTFIIQNNEKIIANTNDMYPSYLPQKPVYADENEIKSQNFLPDLNKYLDIYNEKLKAFKLHIDKFASKYNGSAGDVSLSDKNDLQDIKHVYDSIFAGLNSVNGVKRSEIKTNYPNLESAAGKRGLTFVNFDGDKKVNIFPMKYRNSDSLLRITITNADDTHNKTFLLHNLTNVVNNYNPEYPSVIPPVLKYYNKFEIEELNMSPALKFLKEELGNFNSYVTEQIKPKPKPVKEPAPKMIKEQKPKLEKIKTIEKKKNIVKLPEYKQLMKECNLQFANAMKNIHTGLDDFNKTLAEIQQKVADFYTQKS